MWAQVIVVGLVGLVAAYPNRLVLAFGVSLQVSDPDSTHRFCKHRLSYGKFWATQASQIMAFLWLGLAAISMVPSTPPSEQCGSVAIGCEANANCTFGAANCSVIGAFPVPTLNGRASHCKAMRGMRIVCQHG